MKKLIAMPAFDENGVLNGIELVARIYLPDEVIIDDETIKITGRGINEVPALPEIVFDVSDVEVFANEEVPKLSLPATDSKIARARLFLRNKFSGHFMNRETNTATSLR